MKLFKNGVGRPSNETKQARQIFILSVVAIVISAITLAVCLLTKSNILTSKLKGASSWKVSYGLWNRNSNDIRMQSEPSYNSHNGTVKFPAVSHYTVTSGKKCSFKGWIFQKSDGRYRVYNKDTKKYVWYNGNKDEKINWRYALFKPGSTYSGMAGIPVHLYAAFDCETSNNSSGTDNTTSTPVSNNKIRIVYDKNAGAATGSMVSKDFNVNSSIVLDKNKYKLDGYNFAGWKAYKIVNNVKKYYKVNWSETNFEKASIIKDGTDLKKEITCSDGCLKDGDTVYLQAKWVELKGQDGYYTIVFKPNGGSGSMSNQEIKKASGNWGSSNLKGNSFSRIGYKFNGWKAYRIVNGNKKYFVKKKGWVGESSSSATTIGNKVDIQKNYVEDSINETYDIDKYTSPGKYIYLEAQWKVDDSRWLIEVDKNGGTLKSGKASSFTLTKSNALPSCSSYISRSGYTCAGWYIYRKDMNGGRITYYTGSTGWKTDSSKAAYFTGSVKLNALYNNTPYGITLYIKPYWVKDTTTSGTLKWTINIDRNGGTKISGSSDSFSTSSKHTLPGCSYYATKTGYTCTGWKLYRKDVNGGRSTFFTMSPKKGWRTTVSGNGYVFNNYYSLSNIKDFIGDGKTFYAQIQWKKKNTVTTTTKTTTGVKKWTVIINKGEGSFKKSNHNTTKSSVLTIKSNGTLPSCINYLERSGYTCTGWKLYIDTRNGSKYFVSGKGWTGNYQQGTNFSSNSKISSIYNFTGDGATIYIKPVWYKK